MTTKEIEDQLNASAREVFEIIPSYIESRHAASVASVMASLVLRLYPHVAKSAEVREMLESYAALDRSYDGR